MPDPTARASAATVATDLATLQAQVDGLGSGGLTQAQVDDRIETLVEDFAENSSTARVPATKLFASTATQSGIAAGVSNSEIDSEAGTTRFTWAVNHVKRLVYLLVPEWAQTGNNTAIPASKLSNAPSGGLSQGDVDARVQAGVQDWAETGNTDNVPAGKLPGATAGDVGAVQAVTTQIVDTEAGTAVLGWSVNLFKRLVFRIIPSWAHAGNTDMIPANKLPPSMGGGGFTLHSGPANPPDAIGEDMDWYIQTTNGQFWQKAGGTWLLRYTDQLGQAGAGITETQARGLIADWAETGNNSVIPSGKLPTSTAANPGIAQGVTDSEIDTEAGNTRLTWSVTHVKRLVDRLTSFGVGVSSAIGNVASAGVSLVYSRHDHAHNLPTDSTISYDEIAETFGVSVHNVIEALQERIRQYHTDSSDYSSSAGRDRGQAYAPPANTASSSPRLKCC